MEIRNLIKYILKEETSSENLNKGIDIAVKILKKEYPFVVGWELADEPDQYTFTIYINLEIDYSKMTKFYNLGPHPIYHKLLKSTIENRDKLSYPYSMTDYENVGFKTDEYVFLENDLSEIYDDMIPYNLKLSIGPRDDAKRLSVDGYIFVR